MPLKTAGNVAIVLTALLELYDKFKTLRTFSLTMLTDNNVLPTDLRQDAIAIEKTLAWDDEGGQGMITA